MALLNTNGLDVGLKHLKKFSMSNSTEDGKIDCEINHMIHQYLFCATYILVLLIGVPTNLYSLYHAWQQTQARNQLGIYLLNLTASDLLYLASLPLWLQYFFQDDNWTYKEWVCQLCGFLLYQNIYISVGFLCCISIDRYLAIVYPLRSRRFRTMRTAMVVSAVIWLKELVVGIVFFHTKELSIDQLNHSICFEHYPIMPWERIINYYRFFVGFLFPLGILSVSCFLVLRVVSKSTGTQDDQKSRIKHLLTGTVVIFLVCFSPYHVILLLRTILEKECFFISSIFNYYHFSLMLTSFNCLADPVLYCFVSESSRQGVRQTLTTCTEFLTYRRRENYGISSKSPSSKESGTSFIPLQPKIMEMG